MTHNWALRIMRELSSPGSKIFVSKWPLFGPGHGSDSSPRCDITPPNPLNTAKTTLDVWIQRSRVESYRVHAVSVPRCI